MEEQSRSCSPHGLATMADQELQRVLEALQQRERDVEKLRAQLKEVLHINHQWDVEYRELQQKFELCQQDMKSGSSQVEGEELTEGIKQLELKQQREEELMAELAAMREELDSVRETKERLEKNLSDVRVKYDAIKRSYDEAVQVKASLTKQLHELRQQQQQQGSPQGSARLAQLKEEVTFLHQQLKAYQEDFEAERRDRQRMGREKEMNQIHYEAEMTSLKLQLDRCKSELTRFQMEANRLSQQLRLRRQAEQEQFRKHLENKGYAPRYPNQPLPPLDPYVENDIPSGYHTPQQQRSRYGGFHSDGSPQFRRVGPILLQSRDSDLMVAGDNDYTAPHELPGSASRHPPTVTPHHPPTVTPSHHTSNSSHKYSCPNCHKDDLCSNCV